MPDTRYTVHGGSENVPNVFVIYTLLYSIVDVASVILIETRELVLYIFMSAKIVATKTTARKYSQRTLWKLSEASFIAAVVFVRSICSKGRLIIIAAKLKDSCLLLPSWKTVAFQSTDIIHTDIIHTDFQVSVYFSGQLGGEYVTYTHYTPSLCSS